MCKGDPQLLNGLFFSPNGKAYKLAIIDPLTHFGLAKQSEYAAKSTIHRMTMSCVPPKNYADRFKQAMKKYISVIDEIDPQSLQRKNRYRNDESLVESLPDSFL